MMVAHRVPVEVAGPQLKAARGVGVAAAEGVHELVGGVPVPTRDAGSLLEAEQGDRDAALPRPELADPQAGKRIRLPAARQGRRKELLARGGVVWAGHGALLGFQSVCGGRQATASISPFASGKARAATPMSVLAGRADP